VAFALLCLSGGWRRQRALLSGYINNRFAAGAPIGVWVPPKLAGTQSSAFSVRLGWCWRLAGGREIARLDGRGGGGACDFPLQPVLGLSWLFGELAKRAVQAFWTFCDRFILIFLLGVYRQ